MRAKENTMRKTAQIVLTCCLVILVSSWGGKVLAQESDKTPETAKAPEPPAHFFHLEFVVQETGPDGKPTNSRTYSGTVSTSRTDRGFSMRTGSRVPIVTGMTSVENKNMPVQFQYIDVGVSIDARDARENGDKLALSLNADISSLADPAGSASTSTANNGAPVVRQNKWQAGVLIPIGKPAVVFTSDVLDSKGGMQLVVTATPIR
jgi:hypothetical protein